MPSGGWILSLLALSLFLRTSISWGTDAPEHQLKAAFLYNFVKYTTWPTEPSPILLCVLGKDPFAGVLDKLTSENPIQGRAMKVIHSQKTDALKPCSVVFIPDSEQKELPEILDDIGSRGVLSVGESADFIAQGGMIRFMVKDNKLRFEVNLPVVERSGLKIDARVLRLAEVRR